MKLKAIKDQVVVITGATSGNGLAIAELAAAKGARVVLVARNEHALHSVKARLEEQGGHVAVCIGDVAQEETHQRIVAIATETFGGFDSWVNNAATATYGTLEQVPVVDHQRIFDVNYFGVLYGCLAATSHLRERGGAIINIGSILGDRAILQQGPYCATKHALQGLTDTLRMELEREQAGISVTLIKPGAVDTLFPEHARNYMDDPPRLPPPLYHPDVVADAVIFACAHPRRELYVGGGGLLSSLTGRLAPRLTDLAMEAFGTPIQQKQGDPGDSSRRDNLYESRADGAKRGSQHVAARRTSLTLQLQKRPGVFTIAALAAGAGLSLGARVLRGSSRQG